MTVMSNSISLGLDSTHEAQVTYVLGTDINI